MALKVARDDRGFMKTQKKIYNRLNEETRLEAEASEKLPDLDLKAHMEQLESYGLMGDFQSNASKASNVVDFISDMQYKYLQDIKARMRAGEYGKATPAILLRKTTKLGDIDDIINDL